MRYLSARWGASTVRGPEANPSGAISFRPGEAALRNPTRRRLLPPCHASGRPYLLKGLRSNPRSYLRVIPRSVRKKIRSA